MTERICPGCGHPFTPKRMEQRACSPSCGKRRLPDAVCAICGVTFRPRRLGQATCSKSCGALKSHRDFPRSWMPDQSLANSSAARAKKSAKLSGQNNPMAGRVGERNPAYIHGLYRGTEEYRRHRADACADCGATESPSGRQLLVHHIDGDHYNNKPANLVTLCNPCHTERHHDLKRARVVALNTMQSWVVAGLDPNLVLLHLDADCACGNPLTDSLGVDMCGILGDHIEELIESALPSPSSDLVRLILEEHPALLSVDTESAGSVIHVAHAALRGWLLGEVEWRWRCLLREYGCVVG